MTETTAGKMRGRRAPKFDLTWAISAIQEVYRSVGKHNVSRQELAKALGHKTLSGAVTPKIGTLTHFGLLDRIRGGYIISDLGIAIAIPSSDEERTAAIVAAATTPALYSELMTKFSEQGLPEMLPNILEGQYGVASSNAAEAVQIFRDSMECAGLLRHGVLHKGPTGHTERESPSASPRPADATPRADTGIPAPMAAQDFGTESQVFAIPLGPGRTGTLQLPVPVRAVDLDRLKMWIDLVAPWFGAPDKQPDEQNEAAVSGD